MSTPKRVEQESSEVDLFSLSQIRHLMRVEFSRAQRYRYPIACLVLMVDGLSTLRDTHGYDLKEAVLEDVVGLLQKETRVCDYLGRLMHDRLTAILPHTDQEGARVTADRLVTSTRALTFPEYGSDVRVTLSVGMSHYADENTLFFDALLESAEAAAEEAVEAGGNRAIQRDPGA